MRKKLRFLWIDDNPELREQESKNLSRRLNVKVEYYDVKNKEIRECLDLILKNEPPDLIMIDHKFDDLLTGIFKTGSTIAALIRDFWPACPIICITGVNEEEIDSQKKYLYEMIIQFHNISKYDKSILSIANSFKKISQNIPKNTNEVITLLSPPFEDKQKLETILPSTLKENFEDKGLIISISRWSRDILIKRPGFLYDRLWVSTLLGIKEESFYKVESLFRSAKYKGVFADESDPRWWKTTVLNILSKKVKTPGLSFEKGRLLDNITKKDYSKCYVDGDDFPETVAFEDQSSDSKRYPMKLKNTVTHPSFTDLLFFEEIRLMKPLE